MRSAPATMHVGLYLECARMWARHSRARAGPEFKSKWLPKERSILINVWYPKVKEAQIQGNLMFGSDNPTTECLSNIKSQCRQVLRR